MKRTVLVVDDEQNMQTVMRMILEDAGHSVITAGSGEEALKHIQNPNLDACTRAPPLMCPPSTAPSASSASSPPALAARWPRRAATCAR